MKFIRERLATTLTYNAGGASNEQIGYTNYWPIGMLLDLQVPKTDGAGPVYNQDALWRLITGIQLVAGGNPYLALSSPDARSLYWATRLRLKGGARVPNGAAGAVTLRHVLPILFGVNPLNADGSLNFRDASAGIKPDSGLNLSINWAPNTILGANMTVGAATLGVTLLGVIPESPADFPKMYPLWQSGQHAPKAGLGLGDTDPLAIGRYYRRSTFVVVNGAGQADNRTDGLAADAVSEFAVVLENGTKVVFDKTWNLSRSSQAAFQAADDNGAVPGAALVPAAATIAAMHNPGVFNVDWYHHLATSGLGANSHYGINLNGAAPKAVQFAYSTDAAPNTNVVYFHEGYNAW